MNQRELSKFDKYLKNHGCEIIPPTNEYELIRWKGKETGVIYTSGRANSTYASDALVCHRRNIKWNGGPVSTGRQGSYKKQKILLLKRDGDYCFYCAKPLGEDITVEHLIPLNQGGPNKLSNMVLAHEACNQAAGHLSIIEKLKHAIKKRL